MNLDYIDISQMAVAFKKQVVRDFYFLKKLLNDQTSNSSHKAHALQMCFEKFAKFHQLKMGNQITGDIIGLKKYFLNYLKITTAVLTKSAQ